MKRKHRHSMVVLTLLICFIILIFGFFDNKFYLPFYKFEEKNVLVSGPSEIEKNIVDEKLSYFSFLGPFATNVVVDFGNPPSLMIEEGESKKNISYNTFYVDGFNKNATYLANLKFDINLNMEEYVDVKIGFIDYEPIQIYNKETKTWETNISLDNDENYENPFVDYGNLKDFYRFNTDTHFKTDNLGGVWLVIAIENTQGYSDFDIGSIIGSYKEVIDANTLAE